MPPLNVLFEPLRLHSLSLRDLLIKLQIKLTPLKFTVTGLQRASHNHGSLCDPFQFLQKGGPQRLGKMFHGVQGDRGIEGIIGKGQAASICANAPSVATAAVQEEIRRTIDQAYLKASVPKNPRNAASPARNFDQPAHFAGSGSFQAFYHLGIPKPVVAAGEEHCLDPSIALSRVSAKLAQDSHAQ
jgi:hypothetical protein